MKIIFIYISRFRGVSDLSIPISKDYEIIYDESLLELNIKKNDSYHSSNYYNGFNCSAIIGKNGVGKSTILDFIDNLIVKGDVSGFIVFQDNDEYILLDPMKICRLINGDKIKIYYNIRSFLNNFNPKILKVNNLSDIDSLLTIKRKIKSKHLIDLSASKYKNNKKSKEEKFNVITNYLIANNNTNDIVGYAITIKYSSLFDILKRPTDKVSLFSYEIKNDVKVHKNFPQSSVDMDFICEWKLETERFFLKDNINPYTHFFFRLAPSIILYLFDKGRISDSEYEYVYSKIVKKYMELSLKLYSYNTVDMEDILYLYESSFVNIDVDIDIINNHMNKIIDVMTSKVNKLINNIVNICNIIDNSKLKIDKKGVMISHDFSTSNILSKMLNNLPKEINKNITFGWLGVSSGEFAKLSMFSEIFNYIKNNSLNKSSLNLIVIDEADLYLHPEWQRKFLYELLDMLNSYVSSDGIQIIITSHSPIIISDFLPKDIITLDKDDLGVPYTKESLGFGTNISNLFLDGMHISSTFGEHSRLIIEGVLSRFESGEISDEDRFLISQIGNKHMREYLETND